MKKLTSFFTIFFSIFFGTPCTAVDMPQPLQLNLVLIIGQGQEDSVMTADFAVALQQQAAPVMATGNVVRYFFKIRGYHKSPPWRSYLSGDNTTEKRAAALHDVWVNFKLDQWQVYKHAHADLYLFVPQSYLKRVGEKHGFNLTATKRITNTSEFTSARSSQASNVVNDIKKMFVTGRADEHGSWTIWMSGHGGTGRRIAGVSNTSFLDLLTFLNKNVKTNLLYYMTCYGGGKNLEQVRAHLQKIQANFIVACAGLGEMVVWTFTSPTLARSWGNNPSFRTPPTSYTKFFARANQYFSRSAPLHGDPVKTVLDPVFIGIRLTNLLGNEPSGSRSISDLPSVYLPGTNIFRALIMDPRILIVTNVIAAAKTLEKKTIDASKKTVVLLYPEKLNTPLKIGTGHKGEVTTIVSMRPTNATHHLTKLEAPTLTLEQIQKKVFCSIRVKTNARYTIDTVVCKGSRGGVRILHNVTISCSQQSKKDKRTWQFKFTDAASGKVTQLKHEDQTE